MSNAPQSDHTRDPAGEEFLFHLFRGSELLQDSRVHEAKEELEQALLLQPRDPKGQDLLAVVYFRIGHYPRAIQIYEQLKRDNPGRTSLSLNLALCYLKTGQAQLAREELEDVVHQQPDHQRAWGYLGLAYERLADYDKAELAFERGGHGAMARRMAQRRGRPSLVTGAISPPSIPSLIDPAVTDTHLRLEGGMSPEEESRVGEARAAAAEAFQELDSGELSFSLAQPATRRPGSEMWRAVEIGEAVKTTRHSERPSAPPVSVTREAEEPPTAVTSNPELVSATRVEHAPPAPPPPRALVAKPVITPATGIVDAIHALRDAAREDRSEVPLSLDRGGLLTLRLQTSSGRHDFAARFEGLKSYTGTLKAAVLERRGRTGATGEAFGGVSGAVLHLSGDGVVVLGARPGRSLQCGLLREGELLFLREEALLAFDLAMGFENGRIQRAGEDPIAIVQLRGPGTLAFEFSEPLRALDVTHASKVTVRAPAVFGWIGRLLPNAVSLGEAPGGQRGLVEFAGEGTLLVAGR